MRRIAGSHVPMTFATLRRLVRFMISVRAMVSERLSMQDSALRRIVRTS
jgi:hypothetical protein